MRFFGAAHGWGAQKCSFPKFCHTYSTVMNIGIVIPCQGKIQKLYESSETHLGFC